MKSGVHSPLFVYDDANFFDGIKKKAIRVEEHGFDWYPSASVQLLICSIYHNNLETLELLSGLKENFK